MTHDPLRDDTVQEPEPRTGDRPMIHDIHCPFPCPKRWAIYAETSRVAVARNFRDYEQHVQEHVDSVQEPEPRTGDKMTDMCIRIDDQPTEFEYHVWASGSVTVGPGATYTAAEFIKNFKVVPVGDNRLELGILRLRSKKQAELITAITAHAKKNRDLLLDITSDEPTIRAYERGICDSSGIILGIISEHNNEGESK